MPLTNLLYDRASRYPNRIAYTMRMGYRTFSFTYADTLRWAEKVAVFLSDAGVKPGDIIVLLAPNSPHWVFVFWGCLLRGAVPVPLNVQSTGAFVRRVVEQTDAAMIVSHAHYREQLPEGVRSVLVEQLRDLVNGKDTSGFVPASVADNDLAEIMYTSGTTGDPKGVMLSHRNLSSNLDALASVIPISVDDRFLSILPLSHMFEQIAGFLLPWHAGSRVVYAHSSRAIGELLHTYRITLLVAVPEFLRIMMGRIRGAIGERTFRVIGWYSRRVGIKPLQRVLWYPIHRRLGGALQTVASGGAPLDPQLERQWNLLGVHLLQGYGLTETSPIISVNTYQERRIGSAGKALPGTTISFAPDGEILIKGPGVFSGYFKDVERTRLSFTDDGWFKTDDIGEMDADGFLFIRGRKKYMLKGAGAQNVYPEDIEFELGRIDGVRDSAVVGIDRGAGLLEIHAVLLVAPDLATAAHAERIVAEANAHLASYQHITAWSIWPFDDFPRSATRKVKKEEVLRWLHERSVASATQAVVPEAMRSPLLRLLADVTGADLRQIRPDMRLVSDLHLDSLLRIELVARIDDQFNVVLNEAMIDSTTTVDDLMRFVRQADKGLQRKRLNRWPRSFFVNMVRNLAWLVFFALFSRFIMRLEVHGRHHLKADDLPAIFMANHISFLDGFALLAALPPAIRRRMAFAAAVDVVYEEYRRISALMELLFNTFPFPRREQEQIRPGLEYMGELLDDGWSVTVFPEGNVSEIGAPLPLKRGAGLIAIEMERPIIPVKIEGTQQVVPPGTHRIVRRGTVTVTFGEPVRFRHSDSYIEATQRLQSLLRSL